jgi:hypothetical protein
MVCVSRYWKFVIWRCELTQKKVKIILFRLTTNSLVSTRPIQTIQCNSYRSIIVLPFFDLTRFIQKAFPETERGPLILKSTCRLLGPWPGEKSSTLAYVWVSGVSLLVGLWRALGTNAGKSCVMVCHFAAQHLSLCVWSLPVNSTWDRCYTTGTPKLIAPITRFRIA